MRCVVDTSVVVAVLLSESEAEPFRELLIDLDCILGGHVILEATMVLTGRSVDDPIRQIDDVLSPTGYQLAGFDAAMMRAAQRAFLNYGKGRHPARLNFGDCMSYGMAKALDLPLLWKGDDFDLTDIEPAR